MAAPAGSLSDAVQALHVNEPLCRFVMRGSINGEDPCCRHILLHLFFAGIAKFYDEASDIWETVWGDHMHTGYYGDDGCTPKADIQVCDSRLTTVD